ncbi:hypothetical protein GCM10023069_23730 [Shinella granuli]
MARIAGEHAARIGNVKPRLVRTEGKAVRALEIGEHRPDLPRKRIDPVDIAGQLLLGARALVVGGDAVMRIGEPHGTVRGDDDIVRRVQPFSLVAVGDDGDRAVMLGTGDAARAVLAGDEPAFPVTRVAVGEIGGLAERAHTERRAPAQDAVVGNVGEQQAIMIAEPDRALDPVEPAGQRLQRRISQHEG